MNKDYKDYELTAYLLGELDEERRRAIEAILAESEDARAELEELRQTMGLVGEAFASAPQPGLQTGQRDKLESEFGKYDKVTLVSARKRRLMPWAVGLAAAASVIVVFAVSWQMTDFWQKEKARAPREMARLEQPAPPQTPAPAVEKAKAGPPAPVATAKPEQETDLKSRARLAEHASTPANEEVSAGLTLGDTDAVGAPAGGRGGAPGTGTGTATVPGSTLSRLPAPAKKLTEYQPTSQAAAALPHRKASSAVVTTGSAPAAPAEAKDALKSTGGNRVAASTVVTIGKSQPEKGGEYATGGRQAPNAGSESASMSTRPIPAGTVTDHGSHLTYIIDTGVDARAIPDESTRHKSAALPAPAKQDFNTESYDFVPENEFTAVAKDPLSTFSIDVDTASYTNMRRFISSGQLPPPDAVRIEELLNYFVYDYAPPTGAAPFAVDAEVNQAPWAPEHRLVRIALKGREIPQAQRPAANLVFLLDVSGSMNQPNKLPLVKESMRLLAQNLTPSDHVAIVVYAGSSGLVLPSTSGADKQRILDALDDLQAGGSTNGGEGIRLAYREALAGIIPKGVNRVVLCTDGDFNVGVTNQGELVRFVQEQAAKGVFLTVLGFGMGNYKDSMLEKLADKGNGNYAYIDSLDEARKTLVEQISGTLVTIAKDVKIQVEFNPVEVSSYRLIGYENRVLAHQDFEDDRKDAGEIGAGHTVTALYEIIPVGAPTPTPEPEPLKYQRNAPTKTARGELLTVKLRYKLPDEDTSRRLEIPVIDSRRTFEFASEDFRFASAVAGFGMILRKSPHKGTATFESMLQIADTSRSFDPQAYRAEFVKLIREAEMDASK